MVLRVAKFAFFCEIIKFPRKFSLSFGILTFIVYLYTTFGQGIVTCTLHLPIELFYQKLKFTRLWQTKEILRRESTTWQANCS